ncbi:MAG: hypothetical protein QUS35_04730 [bacterium]|nr:hypothetical protein [bacterium]
MKKLGAALAALLMGVQFAAADVIETKNGRTYNGTIVKTVDGKVVIRTDEGNMIGIPRTSLARVRRGKEVFDFETGERYYYEVRRPFLPFTVLSVACGAYSIIQFQEYNKEKDRIRKLEQENEATSLDDKSGQHMTAGIVLAVCGAGSFIMAVKPMEVKVPVGKIKVGMSPTGVRLALNF